MSKRKTERLLSLVVCLLSSQRYLTATQIRAAVPGYPDSFDAFFERSQRWLATHGKFEHEQADAPGHVDITRTYVRQQIKSKFVVMT